MKFRFLDFEKFQKKIELFPPWDSLILTKEIAYQIYAIENENQYSGLGMFDELPEEMEEKNSLGTVKEKFDLIIRHSGLLVKK